ncbi:hypothetical protein ISN45_Aa03g032750 [Arabidopsis thaliana x Arabidopsis arenosa]|uniref:Transmembrane protein n=1 Tax=Arabidopsis thaliana x Arabidopsis arenosa TaxID=1240361 RepID=A0A8T2AXU5_9BRAS|nr:hypothetical protein ISN45_Aa03g032750 [Arabidopsis thaliana x Arabidopsis arenosa]
MRPAAFHVIDKPFEEASWLHLMILLAFLFGSLPRPPETSSKPIYMIPLTLIFNILGCGTFGNGVRCCSLDSCYQEFASSGSVLRQGEIKSNRTNSLFILIHGNGDYDLELLLFHGACEVGVIKLLLLSLPVKTEDKCAFIISSYGLLLLWLIHDVIWLQNHGDFKFLSL